MTTAESARLAPSVEPPGGDVFARIREGTAAVLERAEHVRLLLEGIDALAERYAAAGIEPPVYDTRHHHQGSPASTLAFVVTLDTLNFGSGYFPFLRKPGGVSGYLTIAGALKQRFEDEGPWSAVQLREMRVAELADVLGQHPVRPEVAELLRLYAEALQDLGTLLLERHGGRFERLVERAEGSAARLVAELARMRFYRDVAVYGSLEVPFYKRAQIAAADLALSFVGRSYGRFRDLDRLTAFADNLVPHVLRIDGALEYEPGLLARIEAGESLPSGSPEEIEIRAAAVQGVEHLVEALRARGVRLAPHAVDHWLWQRGQAPHYKTRARHRTRSVFY